MPITTFDYYNVPEIPAIYLSNPDGTILYNMGTIYERSLKLRYNTLSEFEFIAPSEIDGITTDYYPWLEFRRLVTIEGLAEFMITNIEIENDGAREVKKVKCQSGEVKLADKKLSLFEGQYALYDTSASSISLLHNILEYIPGWSLSDATIAFFSTPDGMELAADQRSFDITDKTVYDFLITDVSQTYQIIFTFNSLLKEISIFTSQNATTETDIFISFSNLMRSLSIKESTDELATALTVLGGEGLAINLVNPLGDNTIYDFHYYKVISATTGSPLWMPMSLVNKIDAWEDKIENQSGYGDWLTLLRNSIAILTTHETELAILEAEMAALIVERDGLIEQGESTVDANLFIALKQSEIDDKEDEIVNDEIGVEFFRGKLEEINELVSITNVDNFTLEEQAILSNFIIGNTYTNTNLIQTSLMSETEIQQEAEKLYAQGVNVLAKVSEPRYVFEIDSANFFYIREFSPFIEQLALGCTITIEVREWQYVTPVLLGIDFSYDDPDEFGLILSNRFRMDDEQFQYSDLFGSMVDASTTTNFNSQKWNALSSTLGTTSTGYKILKSTTLSTTNNIPIFKDSTGELVKDADAMYLIPTQFFPEFYCANSSILFTYATNFGYYSIIGRILFFQLTIQLSAKSGTEAASPLKITMPKRARSDPDLVASFSMICEGVTLGASYFGFGGKMFTTSADRMELYKQASGGSLVWLVPNDLSTTAKISITGHYFVD